MLIRSMIFALAVGSFAAGCVAEENAVEETGTEAALTGWSCQNTSSGCYCGGLITAPIDVDISNVTLSPSQLVVLQNNLNNLGGILNGLTLQNILNGVKVEVVDTVLNDFNIPIVGNQVQVCALPLLGGLLCAVK